MLWKDMELADSDSSGLVEETRRTTKAIVEKTSQQQQHRRLHRWKNHRKVIIDDDDDDDDETRLLGSPKVLSQISSYKQKINCSFSDSSDGSFDRLLDNLRIKDDNDCDNQSHQSDDATEKNDNNDIDDEGSSSSIQDRSEWPHKVLESRNDSCDSSSVDLSLTNDHDYSVCNTAASPVWIRNDQGEYQLLQHPLPNLCIPEPIFHILYDHQKEGIEFLARLHASEIGGILGDDMVSFTGSFCIVVTTYAYLESISRTASPFCLSRTHNNNKKKGMGKTFMTLVFLHGLFRTKTITSALIVAPVSVIHGWEREAKAILSSMSARTNQYRISMLTSTLSITQRRKVLQSTSKNAICITTYGMVRENTDDFIKYSKFDYVILDEGHTIKNESSQIAQACRKISVRKSTHRLILTGTPILNNLRDLWALFDFATNGKILGDRKQYMANFANPIEAARDVNATERIVRAGEMANQRLQKQLQPYFLQRLKADILADRLPPKTELIVWTHLSELQRQLYSDFMKENSMIRNLLLGTEKSPLVAITSLKKLCGHPLLFHTNNLRTMEDTRDAPSFEVAVETMELSDLVHQSVKLQILRDIVKHLLSNRHKILIFSQSTRMLDIIEKVLQDVNIFGSLSLSSSLARIDGSTSESNRQRVVKEFNNADGQPHRKSIGVLLLSTKAAGVGLTLNAADRVILFDPSWSPAEDAQAVDRCYRIGQTSPVVVYRLIAAGSVEEKMYEKQIHKDGIRRTVLDNLSLAKTNSNSHDVPQRRLEIQRYFDATELRKLFELGEPGVCKVMEKLQDNLTANEIKEDWSSHDFLLSHPGVVGLSRHDGFYNRANVATDINDINPTGSIDIPTDPIFIDLTEQGRHFTGRRSQTTMDDSILLITLLEDDNDNHITSESFLIDSDETVDEHDDKVLLDESHESARKEEPIMVKENCPPGLNVECSRARAFSNALTDSHDAHQSPVSEKLEKVNEYVNRRQPRRAFQTLTEILVDHSNEISENQEEEIHTKIVHLANTLQLNLFAFSNQNALS